MRTPASPSRSLPGMISCYAPSLARRCGSLALLGAALLAGACGPTLEGGDSDEYFEGVQLFPNSIPRGRKCSTRDLSQEELTQARLEATQFNIASTPDRTIN